MPRVGGVLETALYVEDLERLLGKTPHSLLGSSQGRQSFKGRQVGWLLKLNLGVGSLWRGDNMESTKKGRPTACELMLAETFCQSGRGRKKRIISPLSQSRSRKEMRHALACVSYQRV